MRHIRLLASAALFAATSTFLTPAPSWSASKKAVASDITSCAVVPHDKVSIKAATKAGMYTDYKGNRYFFCCAGCPEKFKKNPAKFARNAHIKTPGATKVHAKKKE
jgi:YHS domain-containing protein